MPLAGLRALIVEADPPNAKLLLVILRSEGADARTASSAELALSYVAYFRPQLVITELALPGMSGLELARELRKDDPSIRMVTVTSLNGPERASEAYAAGFELYVQKPIDPIGFAAQLDALFREGTE
jgi:CheY-like chemotaxis protein